MAEDVPIDFQAVFRQARGNLVLFTPDLVVLDVNDEWLETTGYRREEFVGRRLSEVLPANPEADDDQGEALRRSLERAVSTRSTDVAGINSYDLRRPDARYVRHYWWPVNMPIMGPHNEVIYVLTRADDVTSLVHQDQGDLDRLNENWTRRTAELHGLLAQRTLQLRQLRRELQDCKTKDADLRFSTSHPLRSPLTAIVGFAQLLRFEPLTPKAQAFADQILSSGEELMARIDELFGLGPSDD